MAELTFDEMAAVEGGLSWRCGFAIGFTAAVAVSDPFVALAFGEQLGMLIVAGCAA